MRVIDFFKDRNLKNGLTQQGMRFRKRKSVENL